MIYFVVIRCTAQRIAVWQAFKLWNCMRVINSSNENKKSSEKIHSKNTLKIPQSLKLLRNDMVIMGVGERGR